MERYTLGNERSILVSGKISSRKWNDIFQEMERYILGNEKIYYRK